jgi:hypothetical protein
MGSLGLTVSSSGQDFFLSGPYYPLGTIDTVLRAYEEMAGRKIKIGKYNTK